VLMTSCYGQGAVLWLFVAGAHPIFVFRVLRLVSHRDITVMQQRCILTNIFCNGYLSVMFRFNSAVDIRAVLPLAYCVFSVLCLFELKHL
jgi:hypothetical protein